MSHVGSLSEPGRRHRIAAVAPALSGLILFCESLEFDLLHMFCKTSLVHLVQSFIQKTRRSLLEGLKGTNLRPALGINFNSTQLLEKLRPYDNLTPTHQTATRVCAARTMPRCGAVMRSPQGWLKRENCTEVRERWAGKGNELGKI